MNYLKIAIFTPLSHGDIIRKVLAENGCGHIGDYDSCSFSVKGVGRFRPLKGANPFIGSEGEVEEVEEVEEEKIETICPEDNLQTVIEAIRAAHPYEEPVIDIYQLLNYKF